ncbi:hypothetical protein CICLE_v10006482mg [Citrus x clementina]|uniref:HSR201-like protein n=2 Tax=Citrus TaxID=2706 RepID=A0ACB8HT65_CITSI|nr:hypothetical protein CICLE_v10006482mg [Citrus x clementina]KAH9677512.1 HSR201-like protein [Citrus sinensis]
MSRSIEVETLAREIIKPSSPTPHHLRNLKLSLLDQIIPVEYTAVILFYRGNDDTHHHSHISQHLKQSLSETLKIYYPFAGIIKDHILVESDILLRPIQKFLRKFLPIEIESPKAGSAPLLLIKFIFFKCGGVAIGNCLSHKIGDGCTTSTVINNWAATARGSGKTSENIPEYNAASIFPPDDFLKPYMDVIGTNYITKRFVFDASNIAALRTKVASASVPKPTRVEAVTALIWKCTIAASRSIRGFPNLSLTVHSMNLRKMVMQTLPDGCAGILLGTIIANEGKGDRIARPRDEIDYYMYSNLSRLQKYETDFGWEKPIWMTIPNYMHNMFMLLGTRDGKGMEALVSLSKEDMALFEHDKVLLAFAAANPTI